MIRVFVCPRKARKVYIHDCKRWTKFTQTTCIKTDGQLQSSTGEYGPVINEGGIKIEEEQELAAK